MPLDNEGFMFVIAQHIQQKLRYKLIPEFPEFLLAAFQYFNREVSDVDMVIFRIFRSLNKLKLNLLRKSKYYNK